ncbi:hypothetical protein DXO170_18160 [Xanthomonas oryzae pv. oryzae]|uniref:Uncharacterized protein n=1 Tax=Xanthomonas oryzae pv. oryzae TaxID=64187 RepID=A0A854CGK8_XANOO|nr:hypothetical protein BXO407_11600 [Xanthomonas oryzae pv. oryzae]OLG64386.1 hypothetical protein BXO554_20470 [Xanthomonas oryzae pv. oryzae]OLG74640.1 hypothetical protein BXO432_20900 [Xanthomonas oryzae pv. oryzae]OLG75838.1 hypothetical protein BXO454_11575 [Xanthomonas oryzae pv. oryzae]OLG90346.1 hypothetical protein BXO471_15540 [Xanthomonas oryzae pv. oryzae]
MNRQFQVSLLELPLDGLFQTIRMTHNAAQAIKRQVSVNQGLGLIALELGWVVWVAPEIACLEQRPVDLVEIR